MFLRRKSSGEPVRKLCRDLETLGYYLAGETADLDNEVYKSVKAFQMQNVDSSGRPLVVDGIAGPLTLAAIIRRIAGDPPKNAGTTDNHALPPSGGGSSTARGALTAALGEIAAGAGEVGGNNRGPFVKKYLNGLAPEGSSWCAGFISWCFSQSGQQMPFKYTVGARDVLAQLKKKGLVVKPTLADPPLPGDVIVWWRGSPSGWQGHVGLVLDYKDGVLRTVEGNKSSRVDVYSYTFDKISRLLGFARIP